MNTRTKRPSPLRAALGGAGLARTGALLALALGAAQAGATTYTVPLQFNITLAAPVCTLTVGGITANATTPVQSSIHTVDLTPTPLSAISSPNTIVSTLPATITVPGDSAGVTDQTGFTVRRLLTSPPTASATCTLGTPMTARVTKGHALTNTLTPFNMPGLPGAGQTPTTLPIGMLMGIASFAGVAGATGVPGTTYNTSLPSVSATATGSAQPLVLTAGIYAQSATALGGNYAGLWYFPFNVHLDF